LKSGGAGASISSTSTFIASIALLIYNIIKCWLLRQSFTISNKRRQIAAFNAETSDLASDGPIQAQSENKANEEEDTNCIELDGIDITNSIG
jgi:hypothetical protein